MMIFVRYFFTSSCYMHSKSIFIFILKVRMLKKIFFSNFVFCTKVFNKKIYFRIVKKKGFIEIIIYRFYQHDCIIGVIHQIISSKYYHHIKHKISKLLFLCIYLEDLYIIYILNL